MTLWINSKGLSRLGINAFWYDNQVQWHADAHSHARWHWHLSKLIMLCALCSWDGVEWPLSYLFDMLTLQNRQLSDYSTEMSLFPQRRSLSPLRVSDHVHISTEDEDKKTLLIQGQPCVAAHKLEPDSPCESRLGKFSLDKWDPTQTKSEVQTLPSRLCVWRSAHPKDSGFERLDR